MERGKDWVDKIIIIRDEVSGQPKVEVKGLWSGKDRRMIGRALLKEMRRSSNQVKQMFRQADLIAIKEEIPVVDSVKQKRIDNMAKARLVKKEKKLKEEEKEDVRGQQKSKE